jgi:hypothetical protein
MRTPPLERAFAGGAADNASKMTKKAAIAFFTVISHVYGNLEANR